MPWLEEAALVSGWTEEAIAAALYDANYAVPDYVDDDYWDDAETVESGITNLWTEEAGL